MDVIPASATINLPSGSPSSIDLNDRVRYEIVERQEPGVSYRLTEIAGENQPGSFPIKAVRDTATLAYVIRVRGTSPANYRENLNLLFRACGQLRYVVTEVIDGQTLEWHLCRPANIEQAGTQTGHQLARRRGDWSVSIRCHPRTVA